ncbi:hypothetical protein I6E29_00820 [Arcanobacterium haemolyticum]|nr:hypothetical protein [Arcanobacterium haemolyticum]
MGEFLALVAPADNDEAATTISAPRTYGYTLYIRSDSPPGVELRDVLEVRGRRVPVTRLPQLWRTKAGRVRGLVVTVEWKDGA